MGKSTLLKTVVKPFQADVELYTRMTSAGLDRRQETFDGKILLIEQLISREPVELSFLMSEGELAILSAERDPKTGKMVSTTTRLKGMPVVMSTLTGATVETQFLSRVSTLAVDESGEQTKRIVEKKLERWAEVDRQEPSMTAGPITWVDSKCRELGPHVVEVKAPFAQKLAKGIPSVGSMRRGLDKIASLVDAIAFVKASVGLRDMVQRGVLQEYYIVAQTQDLEDAVFVLGAEQLIESASYFFGKSKTIYKHLLSSGSKTARDVSVALRLSQNRAREYLNTLVELGHATRDKVSGTFYYEAIEGSEPQLKLEASFTEEELEEWFDQNFPEGAAKMLRPERDIPTAVVPVVSPSEPISSTIERIEPELSTKHPTVPGSIPNRGQHLYDENDNPSATPPKAQAGDFELAVKLLQLILPPLTWDDAIENLGLAFNGDRAKAGRLLSVMRDEGLCELDPDGNLRLTK